MFTPMTPRSAREISRWTYPAPYDLYSFDGSAEVLEELLNGDYYQSLAGGRLTGYACFGPSARIPTAEPETYGGDALDVGLGLSPGLCGQGRGLPFLTGALAFASEAFRPSQFRLAVAAFNRRAIRVYERAGFREQARVHHARSGAEFLLMLCPGTTPPAR